MARQGTPVALVLATYRLTHTARRLGVPATHAVELAANIAQGLSDGCEPVEPAVRAAVMRRWGGLGLTDGEPLVAALVAEWCAQ
jgi:hypothetical protein